MGWEAVVERRIQEAQQAGAFDGLPGYGKLLSLEDETWVNPAWRIAFHLLRNAGMAPLWIELGREVLADLAAARNDLAQSACRWSQARGPAWSAALERFRHQVDEMNQLIQRINLLAPSDVFRRSRLDAEREIERVLTGVSRE
jgi:hypothetical protein